MTIGRSRFEIVLCAETEADCQARRTKVDWMDPHIIAGRLLDLAAHSEPLILENFSFPPFESVPAAWRHTIHLPDRNARIASDLIVTLQQALAKTDWDPDLAEIPQRERDRWVFGTAAIFRGSPRPIYGGFLQPLRREPILRQVPDRIALYLITLDKGDDYLDRETHGMGLHYHYLNWRKERSNVILSWDTRWQAPEPQTTPPTRRALFVEHHGEKSNADFVARPDLWGKPKRASMYKSCAPDLGKWPINEFRCASNKSEIVHPPGMTLTPHPETVALTVKKRRKTRR